MLSGGSQSRLHAVVHGANQGPIKRWSDFTRESYTDRADNQSNKSKSLRLGIFRFTINTMQHDNRLKRGSAHPSKNLRFWQYSPDCKNGELWVTPEKFLENQRKIREYQAKNKEAIREAKSRFKIRHAERLKEVHRRYNKLARQRRPNYEKDRAAKDPVFRLSRRMRARIREALRDRRISKSKKSIETIGCGWGELRAHLESMFSDGMSWENMNLWHVDHIVPLALAKTEDEVMRLCHFSNLQPLWATENLSKGATSQH